MISFLQIERAHKILRVLRGPRWNVTKELTDIKVALGWDFVKKKSLNSLRIFSQEKTDTHKKQNFFAKLQFLNDRIYRR